MKNGRHYLRGEHFFYEEELGNPKQRVCPSQNRDERVMHIDYSDRRFEPGEDQVIFGSEADNLNWVSSDHLWSWDRARAEKATQIASQSGAETGTPRNFQEFLRSFYDNPNLELVCVRGGYNAGNQQTYYVFGYRP